MNVVFVQTADPQSYYKMLLETSKTVREYCFRKGYDYESYIGVKRGYKPWHATWNRCYIFEELVSRGQHDWVVYIDADAYIADLDFDFEAYIAPHADRPAIMTPSGVSSYWYDINAGIMLLNLRHPATQGLIAHWKRAYEELHPDESLRQSTSWSKPDDQDVVVDYMRANEPLFRDQIRFESHAVMNSLEARFIRQILRDFVPTFEARLQVVADAVQSVMSQAGAAPERPAERTTLVNSAVLDQQRSDFINACYELLLGRPVRPDELTGIGTLMRELGPYGGSAYLVRALMRSDEFHARFPVFPDDGRTLTKLADDAGLGKGQHAHAYAMLYDLLLYPRRATLKRMLEIGVASQGPEVGVPLDHVPDLAPTIGTWLQYFPYAEINGFDILDLSKIKDHRSAIFRGDAGVEADLRRVAEGGRPFDLIIDDGSHASFHQQLALKVLFPKVAPGGLYVIENLHWQPEAFEETLPRTVKTLELVQHWYDTRRFPEIAAPELAGLEAIADEIAFAFLLPQPFAGGADRTAKIAVLQKKLPTKRPPLS